MTNTMIKTTNLEDVLYITCPTKNVSKFIELVCEYDTEVETFEVGSMPFEALPQNVQERAKEILKAFSEVSVVYENREFNVSAGICLKANYAHDHFSCGRYKQEDIYTKEERKQNFIEEFGYAPCYL